MGKYRVAVSDTAKKHLLKIKKNGQQGVKDKIQRIFAELEETPYDGEGRPEALRHLAENIWSRRIDKKNRICYIVQDDIVLVTVISALGHYDDK